MQWILQEHENSHRDLHIFLSNSCLGRILKGPLSNPRTYLSWSSKIGPIEGHLICSKISLKNVLKQEKRLKIIFQTDIVIIGPTIPFITLESKPSLYLVLRRGNQFAIPLTESLPRLVFLFVFVHWSVLFDTHFYTPVCKKGIKQNQKRPKKQFAMKTTRLAIANQRFSSWHKLARHWRHSTEGCMGEQISLKFDLTFGDVLLHKLVLISHLII